MDVWVDGKAGVTVVTVAMSEEVITLCDSGAPGGRMVRVCVCVCVCVLACVPACLRACA